jgi:hypothetical protein
VRAGPVVGWVTTSESPVLYVIFFGGLFVGCGYYRGAGDGFPLGVADTFPVGISLIRERWNRWLRNDVRVMGIGRWVHAHSCLSTRGRKSGFSVLKTQSLCLAIGLRGLQSMLYSPAPLH